MPSSRILTAEALKETGKLTIDKVVFQISQNKI